MLNEKEKTVNEYVYFSIVRTMYSAASDNAAPDRESVINSFMEILHKLRFPE